MTTAPMSEREYISAIEDKAASGEYNAMMTFTKMRELLHPATDQEAKDAARYRFLRKNCSGGYMLSFSRKFKLNCDEPETEWDAAIDAAIAAMQGEG